MSTQTTAKHRTLTCQSTIALKLWFSVSADHLWLDHSRQKVIPGVNKTAITVIIGQKWTLKETDQNRPKCTCLHCHYCRLVIFNKNLLQRFSWIYQWRDKNADFLLFCFSKTHSLFSIALVFLLAAKEENDQITIKLNLVALSATQTAEVLLGLVLGWCIQRLEDKTAATHNWPRWANSLHADV